ncbi:hypothetical protein ACOJBO_43380 [Rhizobium beringeri]
MAQIVLGLMIPLLLLDHVIGTRIAHEFYGYIDDYETVIGMLWIGIRRTVRGRCSVSSPSGSTAASASISGCATALVSGLRAAAAGACDPSCRCFRCSALSKWAGRSPVLPTSSQRRSAPTRRASTPVTPRTRKFTARSP